MAAAPKTRERDQASRGGAGEGAPIDIYGGAAYDPTANVIALVQSLEKSVSDLREADIKFNDSEHKHLKEIGKLRAEHAETLRVSDLDRLSKTRDVDVLAAAASAAALATAVQTLANTSDRNAETLRNLVNATAATMAKQTADQAAVLSSQTDTLVKDINARIAELQKSQYQGVGRSSIADPALDTLASQVKILVESAAASQGKAVVSDPILERLAADQKTANEHLIAIASQGKGMDKMWGIFLGAVGLVAALIAIFFALKG